MERPRCIHCRNPIKDHHVAVGPTEGDRSYHEDCWNQVRPLVIAQRADEQADYQRRIASEGLAALLSPYAKGLPVQRHDAQSIPA